MVGLPILNVLGGILLYLAKVLPVIASGVAVYKNRNAGSILLMIGSLCIIAGDILGLFLISNAGRTGVEEVVKYTGINAIISAITYIIFSTGFLLYVISIRKPSIQEK